MSLTNRDIYRLVRNLEDKKDGSLPSLEEYLRSLWMCVSNSNHSSPTIQQFVDWLEKAFTRTPPLFNSEWMQRCFVEEIPKTATYEDWENLILFQIADLRRMTDAALLENEYKYLGIDSPSGIKWFNFDPLTYLECGIRGTFGRYKEDEVIILSPPPKGESADDSIYEIEAFTWLDFINILECGRCYE